ncbi:MAG: heavy metal-binding domain-containing protein, partial [archaeon]
MEYTCPHHPEIRQNTPGICPKCGGMKLVPLSTLEKNSPEHEELGKTSWKDYIPLFVIIGLIALTTGVLTLKDVETGTYSLEKTISYFMIGFFLTFAGFKLLDLRGFAKGYSTYDLL